MKFLVPNYSCLQNPLTKGLPPPDPRPLCPQLNLLNPLRKKFLGTPLRESRSNFPTYFQLIPVVFSSSG